MVGVASDVVDVGLADRLALPPAAAQPASLDHARWHRLLCHGYSTVLWLPEVGEVSLLDTALIVTGSDPAAVSDAVRALLTRCTDLPPDAAAPKDLCAYTSLPS